MFIYQTWIARMFIGRMHSFTTTTQFKFGLCRVPHIMIIAHMPIVPVDFPHQRFIEKRVVPNMAAVFILATWWEAAVLSFLSPRKHHVQNKQRCIVCIEIYDTHYIDVIMTTLASQITSPTVVYWTVYSDADQRKHQSSASLAFLKGIHRDRWIPRTKGQLRGKCFQLMMSSWQ